MKINKLQLFLVIFTLVYPTALLAISSLPSIPLLVYGSVTIDGQPAPLDTEISAEIDDNVEVAVATMIREGIYFIEIPDGKANEGKTIIFKVNGIIDDKNQCQCVNIDTTPSINFDLTITTQTPSNDTTDTSGPTGGGGGSTYTTNETSEDTQTVDDKEDMNADGKIDFDDFAIFALLYKKTYTNSDEKIENIPISFGDFDSDGDVDFDDFAIFALSYGK